MSVEILCTGDSDWPRYYLAWPSRRGLRFWNGAGWVENFQEACLYAFFPEVCREFERMHVQQHRDHVVEEFEATITVRLHSGRPMGASELACFLNRFAELFLPTDGPTDDSLIQAEIHWHELRKRGSAKRSDPSTD